MKHDESKKMDWSLFWTAAGVVVTLGTILVSGFFIINGKITEVDKALTYRITDIDKRLTVIETVLIMQGCNIKGIACEPKQCGPES